MRRSLLFVAIAVLAVVVLLSVAKGPEMASVDTNAVENAVDSAGNTVEGAVEATGNAVEDAGNAAGNAVDSVTTPAAEPVAPAAETPPAAAPGPEVPGAAGQQQ